MTSPQQAARLLNGEFTGGQVVCPGPGHSRLDRSLAVKFDPAAPEGFVVFSHAGDDPIRCRDHVRSCLGLPAFGSNSSAPRARPIVAKAPPAPPEPDPKALDLWNRGDPIEGTLGEQYLRGRGIEGEIPVTLRFVDPVKHPTLGIYRPGIVAALAEPGRPVHAVQVTFLDAKTATKAAISAPRICIGKMGAGAVHLDWSDDELGIAEGIETALSAARLFDVPAWACLGAPRMSSIKLPDAVKRVRIFADNDEPGLKAANQAIKIFNQQGRDVTLHIPPDEVGDWNDLVRLRGGKT